MFTGLIEAVGTVGEAVAGGPSARITMSAPFATEVECGDSVSVNGCCLTVVSVNADTLCFDCLRETLDKTNLGGLAGGAKVNLERALRADARLGGHFVQGHVDCTAAVLAAGDEGGDLRLEVELPGAFAGYVAAKGSIAVNGVSLTAGARIGTSFEVWIIPHTRNATNLGLFKVGDRVNLEFDILAKYTERLLTRRGPAD